MLRLFKTVKWRVPSKPNWCLRRYLDKHPELVDRIYECSLVPEFWPGVLDELGRIAEDARRGARRPKPRLWQNRGRHCHRRRHFTEHNPHACARRVGKDRLPSRHRRASHRDFLDAADEPNLAQRHFRQSQKPTRLIKAVSVAFNRWASRRESACWRKPVATGK